MATASESRARIIGWQSSEDFDFVCECCGRRLKVQVEVANAGKLGVKCAQNLLCLPREDIERCGFRVRDRSQDAARTAAYLRKCGIVRNPGPAPDWRTFPAYRSASPTPPGRRDVVVRVGLPSLGGSLIREVPTGAPILVSANAFWDHERRRFRFPDLVEPRTIQHDIALDSAGFVAMHLYGGDFPWTVTQYVDFATTYPFEWWSAMDYCCEREIAADRATVRQRVHLTAERFDDCNSYALTLRDYEGMHWVSPPMPIVQGWLPADYRECVDLLAPHLRDGWPDLIGVGSVCRRKLAGPDGLAKVIGALDATLPPHVRLHLFGVKSGTLDALAQHPRIASIDSCAWDSAARNEAYWTRRSQAERGEAVTYSNTIERRGEHLRRWHDRQAVAAVRKQLPLL